MLEGADMADRRMHPDTNVNYLFIKKKGHYYWLEESTRRVVVSDESADDNISTPGDPWCTEDGLLYLNTGELSGLPIQPLLRAYRFLPDGGYTIPLVLPSGERSVTPASIEEFLFAVELSNRY